MKTFWRGWRVLYDAVDRFNRNDGSAMAGYIVFTGFLSLFPFLIFATTLVGLLVGAERSDDLTHALFELAPTHVAMTLEPVVDEVIGGANQGILTIAFVFAIYVASNAVEAFRVAFDRAYNVLDPRGFITCRLIAVGLVFLGAIVAALLGFTVLLAPIIIRALRDAGFPVPDFAPALANLFGVLVFIGFLHMMHRVLPGRRMSVAVVWPGVLITAGLWVAAASGFSAYLSYTPTYTVTYGALAGVIITLMFFYISGAAIIFGAEFNAALNRRTGRFRDRL
ncbi:YihY/virulence factor BrkB family protein [soil metagenome]